MFSYLYRNLIAVMLSMCGTISGLLAQDDALLSVEMARKEVVPGTLTASQIGDSSAILVGLLDAISEKAVGELAFAFFNGIKKSEAFADMTTLLPATCRTLTSIGAMSASAAGSSIRAAFKIDVDSIPSNVISFLKSKGKFTDDTDVESDVRVGLLLVEAATKVINSLIHGASVKDALATFTFSEKPKSSDPAIIKSYEEFTAIIKLISSISSFGSSLGKTSDMITAIKEASVKCKAVRSDIKTLSNLLIADPYVPIPVTVVDKLKLNDYAGVSNMLTNYINDMKNHLSDKGGDKDSAIKIVKNIDNLFATASQDLEVALAVATRIQYIEGVCAQYNGASTTEEKIQHALVVVERSTELISYTLELATKLREDNIEEIDKNSYTRIKSAVDKFKSNISDIRQIYRSIVARQYFEAIAATNLFLERIMPSEQDETKQTKKLKAYAKFRQKFMQLASLGAGLAEAKSSDDAKKVFESAISPLNSYLAKRSEGGYVSINSYVGIASGVEYTQHAAGSSADSRNGPVGYASPFLPVGIEFGSSRDCGVVSSVGLLLAPIDLGNVAAVRFRGDLKSSETDWSKVVAPSANIMFGITRDYPIALGLGVQYAPRALVDTGTDSKLNAVRFGISVSWDVPLMSLW